MTKIKDLLSADTSTAKMHERMPLTQKRMNELSDAMEKSLEKFEETSTRKQKVDAIGSPVNFIAIATPDIEFNTEAELAFVLLKLAENWAINMLNALDYGAKKSDALNDIIGKSKKDAKRSEQGEPAKEQEQEEGVMIGDIVTDEHEKTEYCERIPAVTNERLQELHIKVRESKNRMTKEFGDGLAQAAMESPLDYFALTYKYVKVRSISEAILMAFYAAHNHAQIMNDSLKAFAESKLGTKNSGIVIVGGGL